ncbi:hypothetical protein Bca101_067317 [Brassica carinata]
MWRTQLTIVEMVGVILGGKVVSSKDAPLPTLPARDEPLGVNTSRHSGSQSSHPPPSRHIRDRLEFLSKLRSERTISNSRERRSAHERLNWQDLRDKSPLRNFHSDGKSRNQGSTPRQEQRRAPEGVDGSSSGQRISAT